MKHFSALIIGLSLLFYCHTSLCKGTIDDQAVVQPNTSATSTINISSSPELKSLTTNWTTEFGRLNPTIKISTSSIADNQIITDSDLSFISDKNSEAIKDLNIWKMVIGHDAIVPVINAKNPMLDKIYLQGISSEDIAQLISNPEKQNWKTIIKGGENATIHYYFIDNESVTTNIAKFTKTNSKTVNGITLTNTDDFITTIQKDVYAIGFCKLTDVRDASTNAIIDGIKLLPIDKNKNDRIDNFEKIYDNLNAFTRGVWVGKYPRDLCGSIYAVTSSKPTDKNTLAFLTWVLASGQEFLNQNGYSDLASSEIQSGIEALTGTDISLAETQRPLFAQAWMFILIGLIITAPIVLLAINVYRNRKSPVTDEDISFTPAFNENSIIAPKGLYFDKTHTWAFMEKDGMIRVGIDDFLQHVTGTLTRIKMKAPGEMVRRGEKILTIIRNGKQLNIYAPISGTIKEQNQKLLTDSSMLNSTPFTDGWVYMIEPKNWLREIQFLFLGENYKDWLQDEFARLKDFFADSVKSNTAVYSHIILQDGGELTDNILADLGPEVWEDFQTKFIDTSK